MRLLLEKGANVEGNIDLDLDILSETPLQVNCSNNFCNELMMIFIRTFHVNYADNMT